MTREASRRYDKMNALKTEFETLVKEKAIQCTRETTPLDPKRSADHAFLRVRIRRAKMKKAKTV